MAAYIRDWTAYLCDTPYQTQWNDYIPSIQRLRYAWKNWGTQFMKGVNISSSVKVQNSRILTLSEWFKFLPMGSILITNRANVGGVIGNWAFYTISGKIIFPIDPTWDQPTNWMWLEKAYASAMGLSVLDYETLAPYAVPVTNYLPFCSWYKYVFQKGNKGPLLCPENCGPSLLCTDPIRADPRTDPQIQRAYVQWKWENAGFPQS